MCYKNRASRLKKDTGTRTAELDTDSTSSPCNKGIGRGKRRSRCSGGGDDDSVTVDENGSTIYAYIIVPAVIVIVCFIVAVANCKRFKQSKESNDHLRTVIKSDIIE